MLVAYMHLWNRWTTHTKDFFRVLRACVEPATLFGDADRSNSVQMFFTEIPNNIPQACISDKGTRIIGCMQFPSLSQKACRSLSNEVKN